MIPRQGRGRIPGSGDRSLILGGAKGCFLSNIDQWYDNKNDNEHMPGAQKYFEGFMKKYFMGWNGNKHGNVDRVWSGSEYINCKPPWSSADEVSLSLGLLKRSSSLCR